MEACFDFLFELFSSVYNLMHSTVFTVYGYTVSYFWLLLSLSFMGFVFTVLIPFISHARSDLSGSGAGKSSSERIKE